MSPCQLCYCSEEEMDICVMSDAVWVCVCVCLCRERERMGESASVHVSSENDELWLVFQLTDGSLYFSCIHLFMK